jgi:hypothetical protein
LLGHVPSVVSGRQQGAGEGVAHLVGVAVPHACAGSGVLCTGPQGGVVWPLRGSARDFGWIGSFY